MTSPVVTTRLGNRQFIGLIAAIMAMGALGIDLMLPVFDEINPGFSWLE